MKQDLGGVGKRALDAVHLDAIMTTLFGLTEVGVMVTDLDHVTLAVNDRFGEIFQVEPARVPRMEVEELRACVYPRLKDPAAWKNQLDTIYSDPEMSYSDELELTDDRITLLRRSTFPLRGEGGRILGRVWTFEDVTERQMRERRRDAMQRASAIHDPDPAKVCRFVVELVAEVFDSTCLLSIWEGERMIFREVANLPAWLGDLRENSVKDSYCQVALRTVRPLLVQDARADGFYCNLAPAKVGLTRYAGVPICSMNGKPVGTLCVLDSNSSVAITPEDLEFLTVMANRIGTELERERLYEERVADQRRTLAQQERELEVTREVLLSMNAGFELLSRHIPPEGVLESEAQILCGLLGYRNSAIGKFVGDKLAGFVSKGAQLSEPFELEVGKSGPLSALKDAPPGEFTHAKLPRSPMRTLIGSEFVTMAVLPTGLRDTFVILLGRDEAPPLGDQHHATHLLAVIDQVALLLATSRLNEDLRAAHADLQDAQQRMIQGEKLGVVGALSASVAHDIRNILASISIECSMTSQEPSVTLANVRRQTERFSVLSHRLLSYARPKFISRELVDLNDVVSRALEMLQTQIRVTGVQLAADLDPDVGAVSGDPHRIEHLLVNLMLNALQAVGTHNGRLGVVTERKGRRASIWISDNGRGMSADTIERVFEPFYSTRADGFGLGLYSCRKIAEEHGWNLLVESEVGKGSTFRIEIPLEERG